MMQQLPLLQERQQQQHGEPRAYGSYDYNLQATEDHEDDLNPDNEPKIRKPVVRRFGKPPNYKPTPLRWPFLAALIALLCVAIALVVAAQKAMPDSDTSAVFLGINPTVALGDRRLRFARAVGDNSTSTVLVEPTTKPPTTSTSLPTTPSTPTSTPPPSTSSHPETSRSSSTKPSTGTTATDVSNFAGSSGSTSNTDSGGSQGRVAGSSTTSRTTNSGSGSLVPISTFVTSVPINITVPAFLSTVVEASTSSRVVTMSSAIVIESTMTIPVAPGFTGSFIGTATFEDLTSVVSSTSFSTFLSTVVEASTSTKVFTVAPSLVATYGEVVVTQFQTVIAAPEVPVTPGNSPDAGRAKQTVGTEVINPVVVTVTNVAPPIAIAVPTVEVKTEVFTPVETGVVLVGGLAVTEVVVITPSPQVGIPRIATVDGAPVTVHDVVAAVAGQPFTYTAVSIVGGNLVTQVIVTTPVGTPFQPVSYTTTRMVGGTPTVITLTPPPTTFVTTVDGTPVTRVTTPPVTSFTTTLGGTPTVEVVVITPTGSAPITLTFVSTSGGSLSTFTRTLAPTTIVTTISGKLTTIISTPSASIGLTTISGRTRTFTSTLSPTRVSDKGATPRPSVIASTKTYRWGPKDLFIGTFLPQLIGILLVVLVRIIDINAKLYQPFQSLAQESGASGAEALTMQYSGVMSFITPAVTLLQGHPIPFITTLMVGCASFIVPLATEAIGLKLHGTCYLNTADSRCGPALGVSTTPANILIGVAVAVIVMLAAVLGLMFKWATGLHANPWNLAGIASLAVNGQVRIQQVTEEAMKRAVSPKQYGLGYFQNAFGREEYGIILLDESGRSLHEDVDGGALDEYDSATAARLGPRGVLPFMVLRYPWRICFILFQLAMFIFVLYYHIYYTGKIDDGRRLWEFMSANHFGVRFVFSFIGVIIALCWQSFFLGVSIMTPYQLMANRTQPAERSILFTPSTNPFSGIWAAIKHRHLFYFLTCLAAIFSEFLPMLFANIPFSLTQVYASASACAILSAIFLAIQITVLFASFFVRYPPMPVDPRTIAGAMYYVSQSQMLNDFAGISQLNKEERERSVKELGRRYFYGVLMRSGRGIWTTNVAARPGATITV
ncbi:hypothetical protein QBC39DRAFT_424624 [Podospora conica]|nr:hypothetical protein QBC39DRAFT_424624 [Schizothecium conicum]